MSKINDVIGNSVERFTLLITIATQLFAEKFYAGRSVTWGAVTGDVAINAEKAFNDPTNGSFNSAVFQSTVEVLTGQKIQRRNPWMVDYAVGIVVVPTAPLYGNRTDDGYAVGASYLCTNESSGGKFRGVDNIASRMGKSTKGGTRTGDASFNEVGLMTHISDEVRPATEEEISTLVTALLEVKGLTLLQDLLPDLETRYGHFAPA